MSYSAAVLDEEYIRNRVYWHNKLKSKPSIDEQIFINVPSKEEEKFLIKDFQFEKELLERIKLLCGENKLSIYVLIATGFSILLNKYKSISTVELISPVYNGGNTQSSDNLIVLNNSLEVNSTFKELLIQLKETVIQGYQHQTYPIEEIIKNIFLYEGLNVKRFSCLPVLAMEGIHDIGLAQKHSGLILNFSFNTEASCKIIYNNNHYSERHITGLFKHLSHILLTCIKNTDIKIKDVEIFNQADKTFLLDEINNTYKEFPDNATFSQLFKLQVEKTPDRIAYECHNQFFSYRNLWEKSNSIGNYITKKLKGAVSEPIAVLLDREPELILSILSIWKASSVYVPLELNTPGQRIRYILDKIKSKVVITNRETYANGLGKKIDQIYGNSNNLPFEFIFLDEVDYNECGICPEIKTTSKDPAYIIFTSGTTGDPKGAIVEHLGMINHLYAKINDLNINSGSCVSQNSPHVFDISIWQMFASFLVGGKTIMYGNKIAINPGQLIYNCGKDGITHLEVVPTYLTLLLRGEKYKKIKLNSLSYLLITGEELKIELAKKWFDTFNIPFVNAYGPTEASDDITHKIYTKENFSDFISLGKPVQNMKIYIVNDNNNLCPVGIKGEVCVSGVGVGKGYVNDHKKTQKAFQPNPFVISKEHKVLYRTGDLGYWNEDNELMFIGRKDNQIKIRGFRIELEDIERNIARYPMVDDVSCIVKSIQNEQSISAFIKSGHEIEIDRLKLYLEERLPTYMIPSSFAILKDLPINVNGKVDKKVLEEYSIPVDKLEKKVTKPENETELLLWKLWAEVLNREDFGVDDNFFDLGGDSFKAIRLSTIAEFEILINDIYDHPTIKELVEKVKNKKSQNGILIKLNKPKGKINASIIAVANSAGDPADFKQVVEYVNRQENNVSFYGFLINRQVKDGKVEKENALESMVNKAISEIKRKIKGPIIIYGQCNGSGVALKLALALEKNDLPLKNVYIGAALPRMRKSVSKDKRKDEIIIKMVKRNNGNIPEDPIDKTIFLENFRHDSELASAAYNTIVRDMKKKMYKKLNAPLTCLIGEQDEIYDYSDRRLKNWSKYANEHKIVTIKNAGHFLHFEAPKQIAEILISDN